MQDRGSPLYHLTLLFLSVYVLSAILIEAFWVTDPEVKQVLQHIDLIVCLFFLADFFVNFVKAESKLQYMRWGWIDLLSSIPAIDPLRWGRVSKVVRIIRYLRAIKSIKILLNSLHASKLETLTRGVFLVVFLSFTLASAFILEFERPLPSQIKTAEAALWWAFLNIMNAKAAVNQALSPEGVTMTLILNKVGLLLFAYGNSLILAWLISKKQNTSFDSSSSISD